MTEETRKLIKSYEIAATNNRETRERNEDYVLEETLKIAKNNTSNLNKLIFKYLSHALILNKNFIETTDEELCHIRIDTTSYVDKKEDLYEFINFISDYRLNLKAIMAKDITQIYSNDQNIKTYREVKEQKSYINMITNNMRINGITKYNKDDNNENKIVMMYHDHKLEYFLLYPEDYKKLGITVEYKEDGTILFLTNTKTLCDTLEKILTQKAFNNSHITLEDMSPLISTYKDLKDGDRIANKYRNMCQKNLEEFEYKLVKSLLIKYNEDSQRVNMNYRLNCDDYIVIIDEKKMKESLPEDDYYAYKAFTASSQKTRIIFFAEFRNGRTVYLPIIYSDLLTTLNELYGAKINYEIMQESNDRILKISVDSLALEDLIFTFSKERQK